MLQQTGTSHVVRQTDREPTVREETMSCTSHKRRPKKSFKGSKHLKHLYTSSTWFQKCDAGHQGVRLKDFLFKRQTTLDPCITDLFLLQKMNQKYSKRRERERELPFGKLTARHPDSFWVDTVNILTCNDEVQL